MSKDEQTEGMNQLCKSYGFMEVDIPNFSILYKHQLSNIEEAYQSAKLIQLFQICKGSAVTIASTISQPQRGMVKGTEHKVNIDSGWLKEYTIEGIKKRMHLGCLLFKEAFLKYGIDIDNIEPDNIEDVILILAELKKLTKCTDNTLKGWYLHDMYYKFTEDKIFPKDCTERKKYSFLYDYCVLIEEANNIGEGFSGDIGKDKYTQVKNWINAYKNKRPKIKYD